MASALRLLNVVAFDETGNAMVFPLKKWKISYQARQACIEVKCDGYAKTYNLRTDVVAVGVGEATNKVSIGKTLGRVALTGLLHGRHAASADLRWGGVDRDESQDIYLVMDDTTRVCMEMDGSDFDDLAELLPDAAKDDDAQARVQKLLERIKAMVADGERVLDELTAKRQTLEAERVALLQKVTDGGSFDERHEARERETQIGQQLNELAMVQRAVLYDFAVIRTSQRLKAEQAEKDRPKPPPPIEKAAGNKPMPLPSSAANLKLETVPERKTSFLSKVVKVVVWLVGAFAGFIFNGFLGLLLGSSSVWFLLIVTLPLGGWLALKMLAALMRR